ncbi:hypothetical protein [Syntrophobacter fumaroxidans]|uniref:hypothetical protein n=1 Tax=Syntrophobacter fumaroxidans TaxID=119484 RepID=UPI0012379B56|nr:hypothetical protein [Syntrophobacter fumaroxidans]
MPSNANRSGTQPLEQRSKRRTVRLDRAFIQHNACAATIGYGLFVVTHRFPNARALRAAVRASTAVSPGSPFTDVFDLY